MLRYKETYGQIAKFWPETPGFCTKFKDKIKAKVNVTVKVKIWLIKDLKIKLKRTRKFYFWVNMRLS